MAEEIQGTIDGFKQATEAAQTFQETGQNAADIVRQRFIETNREVTSLADKVQNGTRALTGFLSQSVGLSNLSTIYSDLKRVAMSTNAETNNGLLETVSIASTMLLPSLTKGSAMFGEFGSSGSEAGQKISDSFNKIVPFLDMFSNFKPISFLSEGLKESVSLAEKARGSELALFKMAAASGSLNTVLDGTGDITQKLSDINSGYSKRLEDSGNITGRLSSELTPYINNLNKIPNALDTVISSNDKTGQSMSLLSSSIQLADGLGIKHAELTEYMAKSHNKFGTSVQDTMQNFAGLRKQAQDLEIPFDIMHSYISRAQEGVSSLGDASESAIKMLESLGRVMQATGTSKGAMTDILGNMMGNIGKDSDMGKAAFINQSSGNRGGLAGAFEIDLLKQQGNFAEVASRTIKALEKSGVGSPVTLQNVKDNPALAGKLMQQREMVKQFGMANNDQDAYRVLETLQAGGGKELENVLKSMKDPQEDMVDALDVGNKLSQTANNTLVRMANATERLQRLGAQNNLSGLEKLDVAVGGNEIGNSVRESTVTGAIISGREKMRPENISDRINEINRTNEVNQTNQTNEINITNSSQQVTDKTRSNFREYGQITTQESTGAELWGRAEDMAKSVTQMFTVKKDEILNALDTKIQELNMQNTALGKTIEGIHIKDAESSTANKQQIQQKTQLEGNLNVTIDLKDGIRQIAHEQFTEDFAKMQKDQGKQGFTGVK